MNACPGLGCMYSSVKAPSEAKGVRPSGAGVTGSWAAWHGWWDWTLTPLQEEVLALPLRDFSSTEFAFGEVTACVDPNWPVLRVDPGYCTRQGSIWTAKPLYTAHISTFELFLWPELESTPTHTHFIVLKLKLRNSVLKAECLRKPRWRCQ